MRQITCSIPPKKLLILSEIRGQIVEIHGSMAEYDISHHFRFFPFLGPCKACDAAWISRSSGEFRALDVS